MEWRGKGIAETGVVAGLCASDLLERHNTHCMTHSALVGKPVVFVDPRYFRPTEVDTLLGDASKAREKLGWRPEVGFDELVGEMIVNDLDEAARDSVCKRNGLPMPVSCEARL
jgi:GDPmannose 4,6-dehydratase